MPGPSTRRSSSARPRSRPRSSDSRRPRRTWSIGSPPAPASSIRSQTRRAALQQVIADETRTLDEDARLLDTLRERVRSADDAAQTARSRVDAQDSVIRDARRSLDDVRVLVGELGVARATAESDLGHLAQMCIETTQASLDQVLADVEAMEQAGEDTPDAAAIAAEDSEVDEGDVSQGGDADCAAGGGWLGPAHRPDDR